MTREHRGSVELVRSSNECIGDFESTEEADPTGTRAAIPARADSAVEIKQNIHVFRLASFTGASA